MGEIEKAKSELGKEVLKERKEEKLGWFIEKDILTCRVSIRNPYEAMGLLYDCLCDVRDRLSMARVTAEQQRRQLAGKDPLVTQAKQNKSFWKKLTK